MRFLITGVDEQTGNERTLEIEAENEQAALKVAKSDGVYTYKVQQILTNGPSDELEPPPVVRDEASPKIDRQRGQNAINETHSTNVQTAFLRRKKLTNWVAFGGLALIVIGLVAEFMRASYRAGHFGEEMERAGEKAGADFDAWLAAAHAAPDKTVHVEVFHSVYKDAGAVVLLLPVGTTKTMSSRGLDPVVASLELEAVRESWRAVGGDCGVTDSEGKLTFTNVSGGKYRLIAISKNGDVNSPRNDVVENAKVLELYLDDARLALEYAISHSEIFVTLQDRPYIVFVR